MALASVGGRSRDRHVTSMYESRVLVRESGRDVSSRPVVLLCWTRGMWALLWRLWGEGEPFSADPPSLSTFPRCYRLCVSRTASAWRSKSFREWTCKGLAPLSYVRFYIVSCFFSTEFPLCRCSQKRNGQCRPLGSHPPSSQKWGSASMFSLHWLPRCLPNMHGGSIVLCPHGSFNVVCVQ